MSSPADVEAEYEPSQHPTSKSTQSNLHSLPPPPFLVPTIIETLRHSKYAHLTSVIPGEADTYCAQAAQQTGGTILSNDSDLWIYDLGPNGAVGSLHQLRIIAAENGTEFDPPKPHRAVQTTILKPQDAARSLNLPNLLPLAYVLKTQQPHSFHSALSHAKTLTLTPSQTATHLAEYTTPPSTFSSLHHHPSTLSHLHTNPYLDPRLSELLLQPPTPPPTIYLPLPLENPTLTTSFAPSLTTREFAYSCCALPHGLQNKCVYEYSRKGLKSLPVSVSILCLPQIVTHASTLLTRLRTHKRIFAAYPPFLQWRLYALAEIYQWYIETGRSPPQRADMVAALFGRVEGGWMGWGGVHLVAQVEASLYSVRMVGQVLILVVESGEVGMEVRGTLEGLMGELEDLPGLAELMMRRGELRERCRDMDVEEVLDLLAGVLWDEIGRSSDYELEEREEEDSKRGEGIAVKGRRKRKRRKKARNTG